MKKITFTILFFIITSTNLLWGQFNQINQSQLNPYIDSLKKSIVNGVLGCDEFGVLKKIEITSDYFRFTYGHNDIEKVNFRDIYDVYGNQFAQFSTDNKINIKAKKVYYGQFGERVEYDPPFWIITKDTCGASNADIIATRIRYMLRYDIRINPCGTYLDLFDLFSLYIRHGVLRQSTI